MFDIIDTYQDWVSSAEVLDGDLRLLRSVYRSLLRLYAASSVEFYAYKLPEQKSIYITSLNGSTFETCDISIDIMPFG